MRQLFHAHIPTNDPSKVEQIKKDIGSAASEMGFNFAGEWKVERVKEDGVIQWRVEAEFCT
jgi:hypothetical protein